MMPTPINRRIWIRGLILAVAIGLAYANTLRVPFMCDDIPAIVDNPTIRSWQPLHRLLTPPRWGATTHARPVLNLTLALNFQIGGLDVRGYHLLNIAIHGAAALILFGLLRRVLSRRAPAFPGRPRADDLAFAVALLWALHPLGTQAVTYVIQRVESLMALFYLLTLYALTRAADAPAPPTARAWSVVAVAACTLGMASKEAMASAPLMALLFDRIYLAPNAGELWRRRKALHLGLMATWGVLVLLVLTQGGYRADETGFGATVSPWHYLLTQSGVILHYLRLAFWPHPLSFDYSDLTLATRLAEVWPQMVIVGLLVAGAVAALAWRPRAAFPACLFFAVLAPTSSVMPILDLMQERRMYLPLAAVVLLVVLGVDRLGQHLRAPAWRRALPAVLLAAAVFTLGILTHKRNHVYRSEYTVWEDVLRSRPRNTQALVTMGACRLDEGCPREALDYFARALAIDPDSAMAHNNRGIALDRMGEHAQAVAAFTRAMQLPRYPAFYSQNNRGNAHLALGQTEAALADFSAAIAAMPVYANAYHNRGRLLAQQGRPREALVDLEAAIRYAPERPDFYTERGNILMALGRPVDARADFDRAIALGARDATVLYNRANARAMGEDLAGALEDFDAAIRLQPDFAPAYNNRASVRYLVGRTREAWADLETCRRLGATPSPELVRLVRAALEAGE